MILKMKMTFLKGVGKMNKRYFMVFLIFFVLLVSSESFGSVNRFTGSSGVFYGNKTLDNKIFGPADSQMEFGLHFEMGMSNWFVLPVVDMYIGRGTGSLGEINLESYTMELDFGIQREWPLSENLALVTGVGMSTMTGELQTYSPEYDCEVDSGPGHWYKIGLHLFLLNGVGELGLDWMQSNATITLFDQETNAGGSHILFLLGFHW